MTSIDKINSEIDRLTIEKNIAYQKHHIDESELMIVKYEKSCSYYEYLSKEIEISKLKIEVLNHELEEKNKQYYKKTLDNKYLVNFLMSFSLVLLIVFLFFLFSSKNEAENKAICIGDSCFHGRISDRFK